MTTPSDPRLLRKAIDDTRQRVGRCGLRFGLVGR